MVMFIGKIQKIFSRVNRLERKREKLLNKIKSKEERLEKIEEELTDIYNRKTCDVCGKEFLRAIKTDHGYAVGGAVFSATGFEPIPFKGKLIDCVCAGCLRKQIEKEKE